MSTVLEVTPSIASHGAEPAERTGRAEPVLVYVLLGACFGIALVKSEATSWLRIQEMMRFQSAHLFAVFASAVATTWLGIRLIRRYGLRTVSGAAIVLPPKVWGSGTRYIVGGKLFGIGWAVTGACPGTMYALLGAGEWLVVIPLLGALVGAWTYGWLRPRLPH